MFVAEAPPYDIYEPSRQALYAGMQDICCSIARHPIVFLSKSPPFPVVLRFSPLHNSLQDFKHATDAMPLDLTVRVEGSTQQKSFSRSLSL